MCEASRFVAYRRGVVTLLLIVAFNSASAAEPYVEAGVVGSEVKTAGFIDHVAFRTGKEFDSKRSVGWKIAGGYRLSNYLALEAGYMDFGEKKLGRTFVSFSNSGSTSLSDGRIDIKGPYAAVVVSPSAGRWHPFAKAGVFYADTAVSALVSGGDLFGHPRFQYFESDSAKSTELLLEVGVTYRATDHYGVSLALTSVPNAGDEDRTGEDDLVAVSLSFQYSF
jgi:hypothetical protein